VGKAWLTIRRAGANKGENLAVIKGTILLDVEPIAARPSLALSVLHGATLRKRSVVSTYMEAARVKFIP
jgi:hypothetical protein